MNDTTVYNWTCSKCGKEIISLFIAQFEQNKNQHKQTCNKNKHKQKEEDKK